jgi:hypothetical protein
MDRGMVAAVDIYLHQKGLQRVCSLEKEEGLAGEARRLG